MCYSLKSQLSDVKLSSSLCHHSIWGQTSFSPVSSICVLDLGSGSRESHHLCHVDHTAMYFAVPRGMMSICLRHRPKIQFLAHMLPVRFWVNHFDNNHNGGLNQRHTFFSAEKLSKQHADCISVTTAALEQHAQHQTDSQQNSLRLAACSLLSILLQAQITTLLIMLSPGWKKDLLSPPGDTCNIERLFFCR